MRFYRLRFKRREFLCCLFAGELVVECCEYDGEGLYEIERIGIIHAKGFLVYTTELQDDLVGCGTMTSVLEARRQRDHRRRVATQNTERKKQKQAEASRTQAVYAQEYRCMGYARSSWWMSWKFFTEASLTRPLKLSMKDCFSVGRQLVHAHTRTQSLSPSH